MRGYHAALGLALAAVGEFLALMLAGAGEGWNTPLLLSTLLLLAFPITLLAARRPTPGDYRLLVGIVLIGLIADAALVWGTVRERDYLVAYVQVNGSFGLACVGLWLALWCSWQFLAIHKLIARGRGPALTDGQDGVGSPAGRGRQA